MKYYLAGPFFNPAQVALINSIELLFTANNVPFFSPRSAPENEKKTLTGNDARKIFQSNVDNIYLCDRMLAVLDWTLPEGFSMHLVQNAGLPMAIAAYEENMRRPVEKGDVMSATVVAPYLSLPDTGTVWEMGYAYSTSTHVYGFTMRPRTDPLNLMLTQCCKGVINGLADLDKFLKGEESIARPWEGHI